MTMENQIDKQDYLTHNLIVIYQKGIEQKVIILENTKTVMTTCTCNGTQKCIHVSMCLSGKEEYIAANSLATHHILMDRLRQTKEGRETIGNAISRLEIAKREEQLLHKLIKSFGKKRKKF